MQRCLLPLCLSGCTFAPGASWGRLDSAALTLDFQPAAARNADGRWLTNTGVLVQADRIDVLVGEVHVEVLEGTAGVAFDPANPPEGYTLCHGGHCHADSGALVPYAEIEAALSGGQAAFRTVLTFPIDRTLPASVVHGLGAPLEGRDLAAADWRRVSLVDVGLGVVGTASGGPLTTPVSFDLVVPPLSEVLTTGLDVTVGSGGPQTLSLVVRMENGTLFDNIDFSGSLEDNAKALGENLAQSDRFAEVEEP